MGTGHRHLGPSHKTSIVRWAPVSSATTCCYTSPPPTGSEAGLFRVMLNNSTLGHLARTRLVKVCGRPVSISAHKKEAC